MKNVENCWLKSWQSEESHNSSPVCGVASTGAPSARTGNGTGGRRAPAALRDLAHTFRLLSACIRRKRNVTPSSPSPFQSLYPRPFRPCSSLHAKVNPKTYFTSPTTPSFIHDNNQSYLNRYRRKSICWPDRISTESLDVYFYPTTAWLPDYTRIKRKAIGHF